MRQTRNAARFEGTVPEYRSGAPVLGADSDEVLRETGQKATPQRMMILAALRHAQGHVTAGDIHEQVQRVLAACPEVHKWAIIERQPLARWTHGRVTLLGDACHPMTPYMAQGAAMAMEDAVVLARCLEGAGPEAISERFARYESVRRARTSRAQLTSHENKWMGSRTDADWVYRYDAWQVPLEPHASAVGTSVRLFGIGF